MEEEGDKGKKAKHPPFLVYQKKLYVMAKDASPPKEGEGKAPVAVVKRPVRRPPPVQRRTVGFRPRPYVKGVYRAYTESAPHLVSMSRRRRKRTA